MRSRIGKFLRRVADRIDYQGAPRGTGFSFTIETGEGLRVREDGKGCGLWYLGNAEYDRAHTEADSAEADAARAHRRELIETAMGEPDPVKAGEAARELQRLIFEGERA